MTEGLVATGCRALMRSRLLIPPGPPALLRVGREVIRGGTNLITLLGISAARWPSREALIDDEGAISYRELRSRTEALADELRRRGVAPGDAVGVLCRNGRGFVEAVFAAATVGADVVLLNTDFRTESLAAAMSNHCIAMVICDDEFEARARDAGEGVTVIDAANVDAREGDSRPKVASAGRIVLLTSGTTGAPKGVPREPKIQLALGIGASILDRTGLRIGSRIALPVPMFHGLGFGMLVLTLGLGGTVLTGRRFDAEAMLAQASEHRADALTVVPVMLARILDLTEDVRARNPLPSLRVVISSGARLDPNLARRFTETYGDVIYNGYGSSEVGIGALATPTDLREAPETVGRPVVGCAVRILDENGRPVGPEVTGRVFVGGDLTFDAYTSGDTKDVVDDMMDTGDMGYLDRSGRLFIVGREDDMIVSGGENVYPRAVENALAEHPEVADNAVIGVPDEDYGERLVAFVVPQQNAAIEEASIREFLKDRVSRFEQPRDIKIVEKIPRNPAGKIVRNELTP
jgi:acyl-CoA synthetase (AMP-forming)/AMP-acid ligase II